METRNVMEVLRENGYEVSEIVTVKNGIEMKGIVVGDGIVKPTLYESIYANFENEVSLLNFVEGIVTDVPDFDIQEIVSKHYILKHSMACLQRPGKENITKKSFLDLEEYIRVMIELPNEVLGSIKLTDELLKQVGLSKEKIFSIAEENSRNVLTIKKLGDAIMNELTEVDRDVLEGLESLMYIISNESNLHGASSILCTDALDYICDYLGVGEVVILPSSIHECLVMRYEGDKNAYTSMVQEVNATQLEPEEVLSDHCYIYNRAEKQITW